MMLAVMVNDEDLIIDILPVADTAVVAALNQRAQDAAPRSEGTSGYSWRALNAYEQGLLIGLTLPVLKGMNDGS